MLTAFHEQQSSTPPPPPLSAPGRMHMRMFRRRAQPTRHVAAYKRYCLLEGEPAAVAAVAAA